MPVIPGSAIKGMCRRGAILLRDQGKLKEEQLQALFGDTNRKSYFTFWDAWYDPDSPDDAKGKPFHRDVITVHHPDYYGKKKDKEGQHICPTDFDDPTPVPFLVVRPKAKFLFAVDAPTTEWKTFVEGLLKWCLENIGIGGKTNAGYGYFVFESRPGEGDAPVTQRIESENEVWENVTVYYNKGKNSLLKAQTEGQKSASIDGQAARVLISEFSQADQAALEKKKQVLANIEVEVKGNQKTIKRIILKDQG
jgi:CRISPR-associated protein Cmr6